MFGIDRKIRIKVKIVSEKVEKKKMTEALKKLVEISSFVTAVKQSVSIDVLQFT